MKRIIFILALLVSTGFFFACEPENLVVLDMEQTTGPQLLLPAGGTTITLSMANQAALVTFRWAASNYGENLAAPRYLLQMDRAGNNFANPRDLVLTSDTVFTITQAALNTRLLDMGIAVGATAPMEFRVRSFITDVSPATYRFSPTLAVSIRTYDMVIIVKPIFMLGGGTTAGWDANAAVQMFHITGGRFAVVDRLTPTQYAIKFISRRGAWEPQWGAGTGATAFSGPLVYRPTGADPDPPPIDTRDLPAVGDYRVVADTLALTYTIERVTEELFLLGGATTVGWNNAAALPFTRVSPGLFRITAPLAASGEIKFIETLGQWQPQWGTNATGTPASGPLFRNPPGPGDPGNIPTPAVAGTYTIEVNLSTMTYRIFLPPA